MNRLSISLLVLVSTLALEANALAQAASPEPSAPAAAAAPTAAPAAASTAAPQSAAVPHGSTAAAPAVATRAPTSQPGLATNSPAPTPAGPEKKTMFRFGVDGQAQAGLVAAALVSLRLEAGSSSRTVYTLRAGGLAGALVIADEGGRFTGAHAHLGLRRYWGMGFAGFEVGAIGLRDEVYTIDDERQGGDLTVLPNVVGAVGAKSGPVEVSINAMFPFASVGLGLGIDLGSSFPSTIPKRRKRR